VSIPAGYLALRTTARQESADRSAAQVLYQQLGQPPGFAFRWWGTIARALSAWFGQLLIATLEWKQAADGSYQATFEAPYTGYYRLTFAFHGREPRVVWTAR
jgi:hypothetical protein